MTTGTGLEITASDACTRAGAFALLLSLALASLIPLWIHRKDEMILGRYLGLRLNLAAALDALDENPLWQEYTQTHDTGLMSIEQLASVRLNSTTLAPVGDDPGQAEPKPEPTKLGRPDPTASLDRPNRSANATSLPAVNRRSEPPTGLESVGVDRFPHKPEPAKLGPPVPATTPGHLRPEPVTGLGIVVGFDEVRQIAGCLTQLNDSDLLTRSRNASDFFNFSIYRWVLKRDNLIAQNLRKGPSRSIPVTGETDPPPPPNFAGAADNKALLGLTLSDVQELAKAELPTISNTVKLGRSDNEVELTTSSLPRSLYGASLFGQVLLFFVLVYLDAFARKATSATHFPSQETIFGAFAGSRPTLAVFFLALWIPLTVSVGILLLSYGATSLMGNSGIGRVQCDDRSRCFFGLCRSQ